MIDVINGVAYVIIVKDKLNLYDDIYPISSIIRKQLFLISNNYNCYIFIDLDEEGYRIVIFDESCFPNFREYSKNYSFYFKKYIQRYVYKENSMISNLELNFFKDEVIEYENIIDGEELLKEVKSNFDIKNEISIELVRFRSELVLSCEQKEIVNTIENYLKLKTDILYSGFQFIDQYC